MKKQTLLGAIALTTLVAGAAGAANAQQYTVVPNATTGASVTKATAVATEVTLTKTTAAGVLGLAVVPSKSAILPGGNSILSVTLSGGHTFGTAVTPGAVTKGAVCQPTTTVSSGGNAGDNSVSFLISGLGGCTTGAPIELAIPAFLNNNTTSLNVSTTFKTELGTSIDGGAASLTAPIVTFAPAFAVTTKADAVTTAATLASGFKSLTADVALGTVVVAVTANAKGIDDTTKVAVSGDVTKADFKFVGTQTSKGATLQLDGAAVATTGLIAVPTPVGAAGLVTAVAGGDPISASTYTVATTLTLNAAYTAQPAYGPSSLQSITREGTTYLIPWVSSGTLSGTSGNSTVIRISNIDTIASGAVSAELLTSSTGVAASTSLVPLSSGITKGGELVITGASLETAIGSNFGRGDIRLTVEAQPATLITRRFIQNVTNGSLTEVSLGRDGTGNEPQN